MKFQIESVKACNQAWNREDRFEEMLILYTYLKDKITKLPDARNVIVIEINTLEALNDLVKGCKCHIVYDVTNDLDDNGVNGSITLYDDYLE